MSRASRPARSGRGFWPLRDIPALLWLVAVPVVAVAHSYVAAPRWLMIHLLLLGAVTHSIMVWSRHFADALLHTPTDPADRRDQSARLLILNLGVVLVVVGVPGGWWPVTVAGATGVVVAAGWHAVALARQLHRSLASRFGMTVRYYVAAATLLPVGAALGATLAHGVPDQVHARLMLAHVILNVLGWMGLTVAGTLVTLWPTMLRTRIADGAERAARQALPVLLAGVLVAAAGALAAESAVVAVGLTGYLAGLGLLGRCFYLAARGKPPSGYPTWSVLAGVAWLAGLVAILAVDCATATSLITVHEGLERLTPGLAAGFGAQVLLGALSYLVPVALGGGPTAVRAANAVLDRGGALRIVLANAGLMLCLLPVPPHVRAIAWLLVLGGLASFVPLLVLAMRAVRRAKAQPAGTAAGRGTRRAGPAPVAGVRPRGQVTGLAATGLAAVVIAVAVGVAVDPAVLAHSGTAGPAAAGVAATGRTTRVAVTAGYLRFTPSTISVSAGDRLVIDVHNSDDGVHDLVLDSGADSGRLAPGRSTRVVVGVVGRDIEGWCSVLGHRQMGMVLHIHVTGAPDATSSPTASPSPMSSMPDMPGTSSAASPGAPRPTRDAADDLDLGADPGPGFTAHDADLPPLTHRRVHRLTLTVTEVERAVAPGVTQRLWTYDGHAPGPVLHGRVGDRFVVRLVNDGTIGHSVDFHAGALAPDRPMRTIAPGHSLVYRFTASRSGVWMYHCSSMPMSAHIANGMFGAVVIEPPHLPKVADSYVLVQSELYLGPQGGSDDLDKVYADEPDAVVLNGYANQYDHRPLRARVGERVRIWLLDAGPDRAMSFHVVGGQFDTTYAEGSYLLHGGTGGSQALALQPGQGGFVELRFPQAGHYPFVSHVMIDAERGDHGLFDVSRRRH